MCQKQDIGTVVPIEDHNGQQAVNARNLYTWLGVRKDFSNWMKAQIKRCDLTECVDYQSFAQKGEREIGATTRIEYALSINAAKEISMMSQTERGKQARRYFIECERIAKEVKQPQPKELTPSELILQLAQINVENELKMKLLESKQKQLEQKVEQIMERTSTGLEFSSIMGYASRTKIFVDLRQASKLGIEASKVCKQRGISMGKLRDPRFGYVKTYPDSVLEDVFNKFYPHRFRQGREVQAFA